jgi:alpha-galactosidase
MYRSTGDINDSFASVNKLVMGQVDHFNYSAPGCYNDLDMLICGMYGKGNVANGGCTFEEYKTHFVLWCMLQSPLMIGCDVRNVDEETRALLLNRDLLAINHDEDARPPIRLSYDLGIPMVLFKHMSNGEYLIGCFNMSDQFYNYAVFNFYDLGLPTASGYGFRMRDIMTGEETGLVREYFITTVPAHGFRLYRARLCKE